MLKTCVIGASGYTGLELVLLLLAHPAMQIDGLYVSSGSQDSHKALSDIDARFAPFSQALQELVLQPMAADTLETLAETMDIIFLATPHQASHDWMPTLTAGKAVVLDLSGAFRIKDRDTFSQFYGFEHQCPELLQEAVYGLVEWYSDAIATAPLVAVPGCYPTASLLALKPLQEAGLLAAHMPVINAVSGVSGAGRKASMGNSFCEVSLQPYGVLGHRHQPEISDYLGQSVIFTPHLGNFKRGILATITAQLAPGLDPAVVDQAYEVYQNNGLVQCVGQWPKLDAVVNTPNCHLHWQYDPKTGYVVIASAIDNLLKGAAAQALQCANVRFGLPALTALKPGVGV